MSYPPLHPDAVVSAAHAAHILNGLRDLTLPKEEWTHGAHLTSAVGLLEEKGFDDARAAMPDMIRRYNEAKGGVNSDTEGYHHTITILYLAIIDEFCASYADGPVHETATALLASPLADKGLPLSYYSKARLFSVEARREFIAPDLKDLTTRAVTAPRAR